MVATRPVLGITTDMFARVSNLGRLVVHFQTRLQGLARRATTASSDVNTAHPSATLSGRGG